MKFVVFSKLHLVEKAPDGNQRLRKDRCLESSGGASTAQPLDDKICMVTGATGGIGKPTAICLAKMGAQVILVAKDRKKGEAALAEANGSSDRKESKLILCDLSNLQSVRDLVREFTHSFTSLNVLVNTAAIFTMRRIVTGQGLELMFATNYLGPFLLTNLLIESLRAGAPSRIITLSAPSSTHLDLNDLQGEKHFSALHVFGATKTADLVFAYHLATRLDGKGITSNVLFPGVMKTNLMRDAPLLPRLVMALIGRDPRKAAEFACYLASSNCVETKTGVFFQQMQVGQFSDYSRDPSVQKKLWEVSTKLSHLTSEI